MTGRRGGEEEMFAFVGGGDHGACRPSRGEVQMRSLVWGRLPWPESRIRPRPRKPSDCVRCQCRSGIVVAVDAGASVGKILGEPSAIECDIDVEGQWKPIDLWAYENKEPAFPGAWSHSDRLRVAAPCAAGVPRHGAVGNSILPGIWWTKRGDFGSSSVLIRPEPRFPVHLATR